MHPTRQRTLTLEADITVRAHAHQRGMFLDLTTNKASRTPQDLVGAFLAANR